MSYHILSQALKVFIIYLLFKNLKKYIECSINSRMKRDNYRGDREPFLREWHLEWCI